MIETEFAAQVKHHVTVKCGKFNTKPDAALFRVEIHSPLPNLAHPAYEVALSLAVSMDQVTTNWCPIL